MSGLIFTRFESDISDNWERVGDFLLCPLQSGFGCTVWDSQKNERTERIANIAWAIFALTIWLIPTLIGLAMYHISKTHTSQQRAASEYFQKSQSDPKAEPRASTSSVFSSSTAFRGSTTSQGSLSAPPTPGSTRSLVPTGSDTPKMPTPKPVSTPVSAAVPEPMVQPLLIPQSPASSVGTPMAVASASSSPMGVPSAMQLYHGDCVAFINEIKTGKNAENGALTVEERMKSRQELAKRINSMPETEILIYVDDLTGVPLNASTDSNLPSVYSALAKKVQEACIRFYLREENAQKAFEKLFQFSEIQGFRNDLFSRLKGEKHFNAVIQLFVEGHHLKQLLELIAVYSWKGYFEMIDRFLTIPKVTIQLLDEASGGDPRIVVYQIIKGLNLGGFLARYKDDAGSRKMVITTLGKATRELPSGDDEVSRLREQIKLQPDGTELEPAFDKEPMMIVTPRTAATFV